MKNIIRILIGLLIGGLFFWLALREVSFEEVRLTINNMTFFWVVPYLVISLFSNYLRAERWKQLLDQNDVKTSRFTVFCAVMLGYLVNYAVPRLGEVSRSVYAGTREKISRSRVMGTVVTERLLDLVVMAFLFLFVVIFFLRDTTLMESVIGKETVKYIQSLWSLDGFLIITLLLSASLCAAIMIWYVSRLLEKAIPSLRAAKRFAVDTSQKFIMGLLSIKDIKNWPLFLMLTAAIWFCYILMAYIPFMAFQMHDLYGLGIKEATIVTVVSAFGVTLPSPGGMGTYHWFVSRSLLILFAVPEALGLSYAIVTHFAMMLIIIVITPPLLIINKYYR